MNLHSGASVANGLLRCETSIDTLHTKDLRSHQPRSTAHTYHWRRSQRRLKWARDEKQIRLRSYRSGRQVIACMSHAQYPVTVDATKHCPARGSCCDGRAIQVQYGRAFKCMNERSNDSLGDTGIEQIYGRRKGTQDPSLPS
jgi:hypothetical protein